jgi:hypothetical protein
MIEAGQGCPFRIRVYPWLKDLGGIERNCETALGRILSSSADFSLRRAQDAAKTSPP